MDEPTETIYLGDGVYASFDGYHVILDLRAQDSTTRIALEPAVMEQLKAYGNHIESLVAGARQAIEKEDGNHG